MVLQGMAVNSKLFNKISSIDVLDFSVEFAGLWISGKYEYIVLQNWELSNVMSTVN